MADNIANAGAVPAMAAGPLAAEGGDEEEKNKFLPMPPSKLSQFGGWAAGFAMGDAMAKGFLETDPSMAATLEKLDLTEEEFTGFLQTVSCEVMKEIGKFTESLKDEDEEKCALNAMYE
jgi:hypothetical protein